MSAQCIYCQSVRAKNTSRQRSHLLECQPYLNAMKEHNPNSSILELANNPPPPAAKAAKKRSGETAGAAAAAAAAAGGAGLVVKDSFKGDSLAPSGGPSVPRPALTRDLQLTVQLNPRIDVGRTIYGERNWVSFISGHWAAAWGKGTVVPGGQAQQLFAQDLSTGVRASCLLQTHDVPPAFVTVRLEGWRVGPREVLEKLADPALVDAVDPKEYSFRLYVYMETGHPRYLHLNTGMWVGCGVQRASEIVMDGYRIM